MRYYRLQGFGIRSGTLPLEPAAVGACSRNLARITLAQSVAEKSVGE